jgi:hypothetical protein
MLVAAALLLPAPSPGQTSPAPRPKPCSAPEDRQFDFWIGSWSVTANGTTKVVGTNDVTREFGGCVLQEHWTAGAFAGTSVNHYDTARHVWHQTWVDSGGNLLLLDGGVRNGAMVMSGTHPGARGAKVIERITWTHNADGTVRQLWQASNDGGATWSTSFDGIYHRVG